MPTAFPGEVYKRGSTRESGIIASEQDESSAFELMICVCRGVTCGLRFPVVAGKGEPPSCPACSAATDVVEFGPPVASTAPRPPPGSGTVRDLVGVLDNIRSAWNVGAMVRTADGAGLRHLHLCGITASPDHPKVAKTALLEPESLEWTYHRDSHVAAEGIREQGYELWVLETSPEAVPLFSSDLAAGDGRRIALVVGHERAGVDPGLQALADRHVYLPMYGTKRSLNVAVSFGAAIYWMRSQPC